MLYSQIIQVLRPSGFFTFDILITEQITSMFYQPLPLRISTYRHLLEITPKLSLLLALNDRDMFRVIGACVSANESGNKFSRLINPAIIIHLRKQILKLQKLLKNKISSWDCYGTGSSYQLTTIRATGISELWTTGGLPLSHSYERPDIVLAGLAQNKSFRYIGLKLGIF